MSGEIARYNTANHGSRRVQTLGVVVHSTRGGADSQAREFDATIVWFKTPISQVSAHKVIGFDGNWATMLDEDLIAWHATDHNKEWLGVELTQPTAKDEFSEEQYAALRYVLTEWSQKYGFPLDREHIIAHSEINNQKTDPGPLFNWDKVLGGSVLTDEQQKKVATAAIFAEAWGGFFDKKAADAGDIGDPQSARVGKELGDVAKLLREVLDAG